MFSASLRAALVALVATAAAVAAAPGLSLKVTGPDTVDGVENMKVVTTLTNTGDETLKLLNDPNSVLHTLPANTFIITTDDGVSPSFTGVMVKYSPSLAANSTDPAAFTVLAPGAMVSVTHDISSAYNFINTGHIKYTVKASNSFYAVNADNEVSTISANTESHSATLTGGNLVAIRRPDLVQKRNFNGCSAAEQFALNVAADNAYEYAATAWLYLASLNSGTPRYNAWFGLYSDVRHNIVLNHFRDMALNGFSGWSYDCTCTDPGVFAYVHPDQFGSVYLCSAFWSASVTGSDSQAGTLVDKAAYFTVNGGSSNSAYGPSGSQALAVNDPELAVFNADSHEYFAENNPRLASDVAHWVC